MIGGGIVGSGVYHALRHNGELMSSRIGVRVRVRKVAVKALDEPRPYPIDRSVMTTDWRGVVEDPQVDVVTELVGGTTIARTMILAALKLGAGLISSGFKDAIAFLVLLIVIFARSGQIMRRRPRQPAGAGAGAQP